MPIGDHQGIELLDWFVNMELLHVSQGTFNLLEPGVVDILIEKAKEYNCQAVHLFNWIKSKRRYYTRFTSQNGASGAGK